MFKKKTYRGYAFGIAVGITVLALMLVGGAEAAYLIPADVTFQNSTWYWVPVKIVPGGL